MARSQFGVVPLRTLQQDWQIEMRKEYSHGEEDIGRTSEILFLV
jgi:hypothetical protein